ncbi:stage II sporulation protein E [Clostridium sp. AL.422]|uniref:stage II sporulation protein E n=1 Tax=Clostridium TaxID=1485 RepID=UPI00293DC91F|nr:MULTISPECIES: stage II sporulation protein E [unclassified Clostridium]MDV4150261.1 stage II sporulation protein E [Clostridium sp. AL.422]
MQYGVDVSTYKRVDNHKKRELKVQGTPIRLIIYLVMGFLLSRVLLSATIDMGIAPFGLAYLIGIKKENSTDMLLALIGTVVGYLSISSTLEGAISYSIAAVSIIVYMEICNKLEIKKRDYVTFFIIFSVFIIYNIVVNSKPIQVNIVFSLLKILSIIPVKYMVSYALNCMDELESNYLFSTEEIISIGILVCLLIAGVGSLDVFNVQIRNILALSTIAIFAYVGGSGIGSAIGVSMGLIIGITNGDIISSITLYSLCGLIIGIFKETGRLFAILSYIVVYFIIWMYSSVFNIYGGIEVLLSSVILLSIPKAIIETISKEFNQEKKVEAINDIHLSGIKDEFIDRLNSMKSILSTLSSSIVNLGENDILSLNNKGTAMVENLADRVCYNCELKQRCWDRNLHSTFEGFTELISSCENNNIYMPKSLEKKCVKTGSLMKSAQEIVNSYTVNEALKTRLSEGRNIIASHINNISNTMENMIRDFEKDISVCTEIDKILRKAFNKKKIDYKDVFSYLDRHGRMKIKVVTNNPGDERYCNKMILPIINTLVKVPVSLSKEGVRINPNTGECSVIIEETPKYHMTSYAAIKAKDGESYIGDSYSFSQNNDGTYISIISDGMGSGPEAGMESSLAVGLIEKFIENGFSEKTAIDTVNSIMAMKFNEDEKFTTMDLNIIDLYTGEAEFIKIGGVVSFIKRGSDIKVIKSNSLPFGILDSVDVTSTKFKLKHGDIIVSISDGVLDIDKNNIGSYAWLEEYLEYAETNPSALSRDILEKAMVLSDGKVRDDMTVLVSKIYSVY